MAQALARHLAALIRAQGPLTLARFMAEALGNPRYGYYTGRDPLGVRGDFITSPEISQMFGELIGLWCATTWEQMGRPDPINLVEMGPGRGTLMADALRAAGTVPAFAAAARPRLVESSPALRALQEEILAHSAASWYERLADVPAGPLFVIANEFFDALPVHQFERTSRGWCERLVDLSPNGAGERFRFVLTAMPTPASALIPAAVREAPEGSVAEVCPAGLSLSGEIAKRVTEDGGAALVIDYGRVASAPGESLQAVRHHKPHPVLEAPGSADISAHVDFEVMAGSARQAGAKVHGPIPQGTFLKALGIETRAAALLRNASDERRVEIASALGRLTDPTQMGTLFRVLAIVGPSLPVPSGFEDAA